MYRILVLLFITKFGFGQTNLRGTVYDGQTKETLIGANVLIKGENTGTSTNVNGKFSISTNKNFPIDLVISYLGYENKNITLTNRKKHTSIEQAQQHLYIFYHQSNLH